jgi:hypothetical protein
MQYSLLDIPNGIVLVAQLTGLDGYYAQHLARGTSCLAIAHRSVGFMEHCIIFAEVISFAYRPEYVGYWPGGEALWLRIQAYGSLLTWDLAR